MTGYWHFPALAAVISMFSIWISPLIIGVFLIWLSYLFLKRRIALLPSVLSLLSLLFFFTYLEPLAIKEQTLHLKQSAELSGKIISLVKQTNTHFSFTLQNDQTSTNIQVIHFYKKPPKSLEKNIQYGSTCKLNAEIKLPETKSNPGQFDYRSYLQTKGISYQAVLADMTQLQCKAGRGILPIIYQFRDTFFIYIGQTLSDEAAAWVKALVFGDDSYLDEDTIEMFQRWGMSHLLAISGLHVGIVIALLYMLLVKLNLMTKENAQWVIFCILPLYAVIAGGEPSVWRASLMTCLFILLYKTGIKWSVTDVLSIVFILLVTLDKLIIYHVGFQLSFAVTFALLISKQLIINSTSRIEQIIYISFIAQIAILPIQIYYFSLFQPLSILVNMVMVPYYSFFVIPMMFGLLIFSPLAIVSFLDGIFLTIHEQAMNIVKFIDNYVNYSWIMGPLPWIVVLGFYMLFILFMQFWENNKLYKAFFCACLMTIVIIGNTLRPYLSPWGLVTMLDIGQGDAFIIELPYRKGVILIDAGATFSFQEKQPSRRIYEQILKPYLFSRGIVKIDAVFITHEDLDHNGSIPFLFDDFTVDSIIVSNYYDTKQKSIVPSPEETEQIFVEAASTINLHGQLFHVLGPMRDKRAANENSLVLYTKFGEAHWLFTGDITKDEEREIAKAYPNLQVDVLKIAHHGSNTSTDENVVQQLHPQVALLSVGRENRYGHPASEVIKTLDSILLLRTDEDGAIQYRFNQHTGTFKTFWP